MARELLLQYTPWPLAFDDKEFEVSVLRSRILSDIEEADEDSLAAAYVDWRGEEPGEWVTIPYPEDDSEETVFKVHDGIPASWQDDMKERLRTAVEDIFGDYPECAFITFMDRTLIVAGGSSWGDDPNQGFRSLSLLMEAGLLNNERGPR